MALVSQDQLSKAAENLESQDPKLQCDGLVVAAFAGEAATSTLTRAIQLLKSSNSLSVKRAALEAVACTSKGREQEVLPLLEEALSSVDAPSRAAGAQGLGIIKAEGSIAKLGNLMTDPSILVRNAALGALGVFGVKASSQAEAVAANLPSPMLRAEAIRALGKMGKEGAPFADGIAVFLEDSDSSTRLAVCDALRDLGEFVPESVVDKAGDLLNHQTDRFRATAALAIGSCGLAKAAKYEVTLTKMLRENARLWPQPMLAPNCAAAVALGRLGTKGDELVKYLKSKNPSMRAATCQGISEMGKGGLAFAAQVASCLKDEATEVRPVALAALTKLQESGSLDAAVVAAMNALTQGN